MEDFYGISSDQHLQLRLESAGLYAQRRGREYLYARDVRGTKGTLIVFICNHCPYVKASIGRIVAEAKALREIGIGTIAIMPNDTEIYREDSFDNMKAFAAKHGFTFPYVIDATQEVSAVRRQRTERVAISRPARCVPHDSGDECPPRPFRSDEADRRNRPRPCGANSFNGVLDQVEELRDEAGSHDWQKSVSIFTPQFFECDVLELRAPSVTIPVVMPPKMGRSDVTAKPAVQQILPFSAVIFNLGNGTTPLPRRLLSIFVNREGQLASTQSRR